MAEAEAQGVRFEIDHYRPQSGRLKGKPELNAYDNLLYACADCNGLKDDFEPTDAQMAGGIRALRVDHECPEEHLQLKGETLEPLTNVGATTVDLLLLNDRTPLRKLRRARRQLWESDAAVFGGLRKLARVQLDALPVPARAQLLRLREQLNVLAAKDESLSDEMLTAYLKSPLLGPDPLREEALKQRRANVRKLRAASTRTAKPRG